MNWSAKDMDTYIQQKDYIDTIVIPLLKIETNSQSMKNSASSAEFLMHLTTFIEMQFKGRIMLLPPFSYTQSTDLEVMAQSLASDIHEMSFKHVFYLTTDSAWTSVEIDGQVIWMPSIPLESMDPQLRQSILEDQLRQVLPHFMKKWTE